MRGVVALCTIKRSMLSIELPPCLGVIKLLQRGLPTDEEESRPIVFGMASRTGLAAAGLLDNSGVISAAGGDASPDVRVTVEAPKRRTAARLVTLRTIRRTFETGVSTRKRARRNLRQNGRASE